MRQYTVQIDDNIADVLCERANRRKISEEEYIAQILADHHAQLSRFPDGVLRSGRQKIIDLLTPIPCLSNFDASGIDFRYWWVSFELDTRSPIAWRVVGCLGWCLNTQSVEMMLPTVFSPAPERTPEPRMRWQIASTAPRLDPADVANWLSSNLPRPLSDESAWL